MELYYFKVFPCIGSRYPARAKHPANKHGFKDATSDEEEIKRFIDTTDILGIACSSSGLVAIDIDVGSDDGYESLKRLCEDLELDIADLKTWAQRTPSGGMHMLFAVPSDIKKINQMCLKNLGYKGIDIRFEGYICIGYGYRVTTDMLPIACPPALLCVLQIGYKEDENPRTLNQNENKALPHENTQNPRTSSKEKYVETVIKNALAQIEITGKGDRNNTVHRVAFSLAGFIQDGYVTEQELIQLISSVASKTHKSSEMAGILNTIKSGIKAGGIQAWRPWEKSKDATSAFDAHNMDVKYSILEEEKLEEKKEIICSIDVIKEFLKRQGEGIQTGYTKLDDAFLVRPGLTVIAALSSHGKTSFMLNLLNNMLTNTDKAYFYFSLEEAAFIQAIKLLIIMSEVRLHQSQNFNSVMLYLKGTTFDSMDHETDKLEKAMKKYDDLIKKKQLNIYDDPHHIDSLIYKIESLKKNNSNIGAIFIDYIQKIPASTQSFSRLSEIQNVSNQLLRISIATGIPIITGAQMNRECRSIETMGMNTIRESNDIVQDAHVVLGLFNQTKKRLDENKEVNPLEIKRQEVDIKIIKNRLGISGETHRFIYDGAIMCYRSN